MVLRQANYGMGCADSVYCPFCSARTISLTKFHDRLHKADCVVHDLRREAK